jgi:hypothetical protein
MFDMDLGWDKLDELFNATLDQGQAIHLLISEGAKQSLLRVAEGRRHQS